jgi:hypothetical protein
MDHNNIRQLQVELCGWLVGMLNHINDEAFDNCNHTAAIEDDVDK